MFKVWYSDGAVSKKTNKQLRNECPDLLLDFYEKNVKVAFE